MVKVNIFIIKIELFLLCPSSNLLGHPFVPWKHLVPHLLIVLASTEYKKWYFIKGVCYWLMMPCHMYLIPSLMCLIILNIYNLRQVVQLSEVLRNPLLFFVLVVDSCLRWTIYFLRCFLVLDCELIFRGIVCENPEWLYGGHIPLERFWFAFAMHARSCPGTTLFSIFKLKYNWYTVKCADLKCAVLTNVYAYVITLFKQRSFFMFNFWS